MKLAMVREGTGNPAPAVVWEDGRFSLLTELLGQAAPADLNAVVGQPEVLRDIGPVPPPSARPLAAVRLEAPLRFLRNVLCVGKNYRDHLAEGQRAGDPTVPADEAPIIFTKATTTWNGPDQPVVRWRATQALDYEAELAVVIGRGGRAIPRDRARDHIFGYTLINDVTARDLQRLHRQWFLGKSLDGYCPIGPVVVTADAIAWPVELPITLTVNGEVRQSLNTADMLCDIPTIIEQVSKAMTLLPGDIIATGTGAGCGFGFDPPRYLAEGDEVVITCPAIGSLRNVVVGEGSAR